MILYDYLRGAPAPELALAWADPATGELLDLGDPAVEFSLELGLLAAGFTWGTKTEGIEGSDGDPNVVITFTGDDLLQVPDGTWVCRLTASGGDLAGPVQLVFILRAVSLALGPAVRPVGAWPAHMPCQFDGLDAGPEMTFAARNMALSVATQVLWALSGRRFGFATTTIRPGIRTTRCGIPDDWWLSWGAGSWPLAGAYDAFPWGRWWAWDPGENLDGKILRLPRGPIVAVHEVMVDGVVVPETAYRVDRHRELVRVDGGSWPAAQEVLPEDDEPGAFAVTYTYGRNVPPSGLLGCGVFACEVAKLMLGQECQLPARVKEFSHGGASVAMLDPQDFLDKGQTGIYLVDVFLQTTNPARLPSRSRVFRADAGRRGGRHTRTTRT